MILVMVIFFNFYFWALVDLLKKKQAVAIIFPLL